MSLVPPLRYTEICHHIYRGSYPRPVNYPYLKRLQLKTIISLTPDPINEETDPQLYEFLNSQGIKQFHFPQSKGSKKKFKYPSNEEMHRILKTLIDSSNAPVYIHCLNGGVVTSLVVGCLRKVQLWNTIAIFREFAMFSEGVIGLKDRAFIQEFKVRLVDVVDDPSGAIQSVSWLWRGLSMDVVMRHPTLAIK